MPGIPLELDALILSLLSLDPLARPTSAAAVIDQLTAIAELEPEEHEHAAESYLSSSQMVGRERELGRKAHLRTLQRQGAEVIIEGPPGIGRTRLLRELCLDASSRA